MTGAVLVAKKDMLRRSKRMDESGAGIVRNGHKKAALADLRRLCTIACVVLLESSIKLVLKHSCAYPTVPCDDPAFSLLLGQRRILDACRFSTV